MRSIQGVIADELRVDPTGTYYRDSDFQMIKDPFIYSLIIHLQKHKYFSVI